MIDIVERLRSNEPLPICPYDRRSPEYWTTPDDEPCKFCGGLPDGPDKCTGADTRIMSEAADEIERLRIDEDRYRTFIRDVQMLAYKWQEAHDYLKAGLPYSFPTPADIPECVIENRLLLEALKLAESVYRKNVVAPGEPSSVLDAMQAAISKAEGRS
ncbi:hypothetical protein [Rhizobium leguminosarum]|uniref:hypothetical protein n=1 Tax=Rhizobium leguminosarum TaxID=384 RepID=UPI000B92D79B|nr:hypothetical protein [Rhizobium leguminosarum]ASS55881.1 hypothetical protein CHR56_15635 [Rhizobium leguminosarum bv. viciae]